ncbi:methyl-accepting chemotaxis protein [Lachnospira pectinoschiza]|uniref:Methyl-accepting chemotaxis protein n=1 Tax=Lachnospira pectinoschiza TaxID=28052 RepID=A0A1G9UAB8_9FIRM|nr:methyl-accepting chemotaxis protein [Lachnospira pectinoschiza]SDM56889.1 methyl-accepting chemotaxis protein [Lachnospira pectinoschiza]
MDQENALKNSKKRGGQVAQINKILYWVITSLTFILMVGLYVSNSSTAALRIAYIVVCVITWGYGFYTLKTNASSESLRYILYAGVYLAYLIILLPGEMIYTSTYIFPIMVIGILFFDKRFCLYQMSLAIVGNVIKLILEGVTGRLFTEYATEIVTSALMSIVMSVICYYAYKYATKFMLESHEELNDAKEVQTKMLKEVLSAAEEIKAGTSEADELIRDLHRQTEATNSSVNDISNGSRQTAENIQDQTDISQKIQTAIEESSAETDNVVAIATESKSNVENATKQVNELKSGSQNINEANKLVKDTMQNLQNRTSEMDAIVATIQSISSQTNLLALNASIEAARAGEAGRGFAVVAEEIRKLAEETKNSTDNIQQIINDLSKDANAAVNSVVTTVDIIAKQNELIDATKDNFTVIDSSFKDLTGGISKISQMMTELNDINKVFVENISQLSAFSEETSAGASQAAQLSEENLESATRVQDLLDKIYEEVKNLDRYRLD